MEQQKRDKFKFPTDGKVWHFHPIAFVEQMRRMGKVYSIGDRGNVVLEINIRLAGFGGLLPTDEYTEQTQKGVLQFQRDYMKMKNPSGEVDEKTLEAIDEFSDKYRENIDNYKCSCGKCEGFGKGQYKGEYSKTSKLEQYHKYEYPGMHQSLLWAVSAFRFYLIQKLDGKYSINKISSGYRCWADNNKNDRKSTNHMGKAVDIHFNKDSERTRKISDIEYVRDKILISTNNGQIRWSAKNKFSVEPSKAKYVGEFTATTWIHIDVREFNSTKYLLDRFFIKNNSESNFNTKISNIKNK